MLLWLLLLGVISVQAQNLYIFSVVETSAPHRPDRILDAELLHKLTDNVARYGNYKQYWYDLGPSEAFTPQTLKLTLAEFKPESEEKDIIWLHYSGRGYSDGPQAWPTLQLNGGDVPLRDLLALLRSKPVRTLLVTVDCGNRPRSQLHLIADDSSMTGNESHQLLPVTIVPRVTYTAQIDTPDMKIVDAYRRMFRAAKVKQIIIMASASRGQRAFSDPRQGSIWLDAFIKAIDETSREQSIGSIWKQVHEKIAQLTQTKTRNRQRPLINRQTITCCEDETSY